MLENSLWKKYNTTNNFREEIIKYSTVEPLDLIEDDSKLYDALKKRLTKKELKLFAMHSANIDSSTIKNELELDDETLKDSLFKLHKKLKQDKTKKALKAISQEESLE